MTAGELFASGWTTPQRMREAPRSGVIRALGRGGYRRYDERTTTQLRDAAQLVIDRYGGDLRRLAEEANDDVRAAARLLQEVKGIGPTGASVFLREVQAVWPSIRPYLDDRARAGARRVGLPEDPELLAALVADRRARQLRSGTRARLVAARPRGSAGRPGIPGCDGVTGSARSQEDP